MDILQIFKAGELNNTYRRIDPEYYVNVFLGYNDEGHMSMVITEYGTDSVVKSSKFISASMRHREDGKLALTFDLLDSSFQSMFLIFCKDIILNCEKAGSELAIATALLRWKYWKELFGKRRSNLLDPSEIQGLIGELLVLRDVFLTKYSEQMSVASWMGPLLGHKDFEIEDTWYEVKTISEAATQVTVNSLEQLDSDVTGHLLIIRLEKTSPVNEKSINLNALVMDIINKLEGPESLGLFHNKLNNSGYEYEEEYNNYCFLYKGSAQYQINESFPCLKRDTVPASIGNAKYTILLSSISEYKE